MRKKEEKLTFTHLRGFDNCSLAQDFSPSPVREMRVETRPKLLSGHCENEEILYESVDV